MADSATTALAILYLKQQDLKACTPEELAKMYAETYSKIKNTLYDLGAPVYSFK
jgi:hypothetical protein